MAERYDADDALAIDPFDDATGRVAADLPHEQLVDAYARLNLLYRLSQRICAETELDLVIGEIVPALGQLVDLERCFVATRAADGRFRVVVGVGVEVGTESDAWPVSSSMVARVVEDQRALLVSDASSEEEYVDLPSVHAEGIRSVMCVPLGERGRVDGLVYVDNRKRGASFTPLDLRFLVALGHYISLGLRNARRYDELDRHLRLSEERVRALQHEMQDEHDIVGRSPRLVQAFHLLRRVADNDIPLLIVGETGTGKELFARAAHVSSSRADRPFVPVNVAALSEAVVESELFGHVPGAFTGAVGERVGRFELADGGTLFLDEIADIPLAAQAKLLRVLEQGVVERVGSSDPLTVGVRLVSATHKDLSTEVAEGRFREDLFFRITGVTIQLPPLREREGDIPILVERFLEAFGAGTTFSPPAMRMIEEYTWPGNVRQLYKLVEAMSAIYPGEVVEPYHLPPLPGGKPRREPGTGGRVRRLEDAVRDVERDLIERALDQTQGNKEAASKLLGIAKQTFYTKMRKHGIEG